MYKISVEEGPTQWETLIETAKSGQEVIITQNGSPIIKCVTIEPHQAQRLRQAGSAKHLQITMSDDFDEPLDDFAEYMW